ncbi:MAG: Omp28-related outer membrane protein [Bacteroidaceae bacterium]|nr:Omp28-related outer membrane protein [Bacteroidaceae bacterium]
MKQTFTTLTLFLLLTFAFATHAQAKNQVNIEDYTNRVTSASGLTLVATHKYYGLNEKDGITFTVFFEGQDVTNQAQIFTLEGYTPQKVENANFVCPEIGVYTFWAEYETHSTREKVLSVTAQNNRPTLPKDTAPDSTNFVQRLLLLQNTGTACGYCPNAMEAIKNSKHSNPYANQVELMALHSFNYSDPLYCTAATMLTQQTGFTSFPSMMFNFNDKWRLGGASAGRFENFINNSTQEALQEGSETGIAIATTFNEETGHISVNLGVKCDSIGVYKVVVALVQDNVYAIQNGTNNTEFFNHEAGIRTLSPFHGLGETINCGETTAKGKVYEYSCEFHKDNLVQKTKLDVNADARIIAYVLKSDNTVDNVASCRMNETQPFAYTHSEITNIASTPNNTAQVQQTTIFDLTGKVVCTIQGDDFRSVNLPKGIYIAHLTTPTGSRSVKFVKP